MEIPKYFSRRVLLLLTLLGQLQSISSHPLSSDLESKNSPNADNSIASPLRANPKDEILKQRSDPDVLQEESNIEERSLIPFISLKYFDVDSAEDTIAKYKTDVKTTSPESRSKLTFNPGHAVVPLAVGVSKPFMKPIKKPISYSTGNRPASNDNTNSGEKTVDNLGASESELPTISHSSHQSQTYQSSMSGKDAAVQLSLHSVKPEKEPEALDPQATTILNQLLAPLVEYGAAEAVKLGAKGSKPGHTYPSKGNETSRKPGFPATIDPPAFVPMITQESEDELEFMIAQESNPLSSPVPLHPETVADIPQNNMLLLQRPPMLISQEDSLEGPGRDQQSIAMMPTTTYMVIGPIFPAFVATWAPEDSEDFQEKAPEASLDLLPNSETFESDDTILLPLPGQNGDKFYFMHELGNSSPIIMQPIQGQGKLPELNNLAVDADESSGFEDKDAKPVDTNSAKDEGRDEEQGIDIQDVLESLQSQGVQTPFNLPNSPPGKFNNPFVNKPIKPSQQESLKPVQEYLEDTSMESEEMPNTMGDKVVIPGALEWQSSDSSEEDLEWSPQIGYQSGRPDKLQLRPPNRPWPGKIEQPYIKPVNPSASHPKIIKSPNSKPTNVKQLDTEHITYGDLGTSASAQQTPPEKESHHTGPTDADVDVGVNEPSEAGYDSKRKPEAPTPAQFTGIDEKAAASNIELFFKLTVPYPNPNAVLVHAEDPKSKRTESLHLETVEEAVQSAVVEAQDIKVKAVVDDGNKAESSVTVDEVISQPEVLSVNSEKTVGLVDFSLAPRPDIVLPASLLKLIASQKSNDYNLSKLKDATAKPSGPESEAAVAAEPAFPLPGEASVSELPVSAPAEPSDPELPVLAPAEPSIPELPVLAPAVPSNPELPVLAPAVPSIPELPVLAPAVPSNPELPVLAPAELSVPELPVPAPAELSVHELPVSAPAEPSIPEVLELAKPSLPEFFLPIPPKPQKPLAIKPPKPRPEFGIQPPKKPAQPGNDKDAVNGNFLGQAAQFMANVFHPFEPLFLIPKIGWEVFSTVLLKLNPFNSKQKNNKVALRLELDEDCIEELMNPTGDNDFLRTIRTSFETASYICSDESFNKSCSQLCISSGFDAGKCVDGLEGGCVCGLQPEGSHSKLGLVLKRLDQTQDIARSTAPVTFDSDNCDDCRCSAECKKSGTYVGYCGDACYCGLPWHDGSLTF